MSYSIFLDILLIFCLTNFDIIKRKSALFYICIISQLLLIRRKHDFMILILNKNTNQICT